MACVDMPSACNSRTGATRWSKTRGMAARLSVARLSVAALSIRHLPSGAGRMCPVSPVEPRPVRRFLRRLVLGVLLVGMLIVAGTGFRVWQVARFDDRATADVVLVLGAAQYDGKPSKVLEARLRHAMNLYHEGVAPYIVTTGGNRPGDKY